MIKLSYLALTIVLSLLVTVWLVPIGQANLQQSQASHDTMIAIHKLDNPTVLDSEAVK